MLGRDTDEWNHWDNFGKGGSSQRRDWPTVRVVLSVPRKWMTV